MLHAYGINGIKDKLYLMDVQFIIITRHDLSPWLKRAGNSYLIEPTLSVWYF